MGEKREYRCPCCRYKTMVAGGEDSGMLVSTVTISCQNCRRLQEAVTVYHDRPDGDVPVRCPRGAGHTWTYWTFPGPCPQCGVAMVAGDMVVNWD
jgi:hypothetical protein